MAGGNTPVERISTLETKSTYQEDAINTIEEQVRTIDDKLDAHILASGTSHAATQSKISAMEAKVDGQFAALHTKLDTKIEEINKAPSLTKVISNIWANPLKAAQLLFLLMTLGSFVAACGAWLRGGPVPSVPSVTLPGGVGTTGANTSPAGATPTSAPSSHSLLDNKDTEGGKPAGDATTSASTVPPAPPTLPATFMPPVPTYGESDAP